MLATGLMLMYHKIQAPPERDPSIFFARRTNTYGAQNFENGLTYVIRRNIEFVTLAKVEIEQARDIKRPFNNLYELTGNTAASIEEEVQKSLNRKTSQDDTHPSPVDRFRFIKGLGNEKGGNNDQYVRDLFKDWNALTKMTKHIEYSWKTPDTSTEPE